MDTNASISGRHYAIQDLPPPADTSHIRRKFLDIPYASLSPAQKLDIYLPDEGDGPFSVIVAIHGGAFMGCDKADLQVTPMLEGLKQGYAVVAINYRLSGEAQFPALVHDAKAAVRWIRAHAGQYGFDPTRVAAWGGSAGGYQATMLGVSAGIPELEDLGLGNPDHSSNVQAVVDWFGPTDFLKMDEQLAAFGFPPPAGQRHNDADSPESLLLGRRITEIPDLVRAANPETYVRSNAPPFLIQHGTHDPVVPVQQSIQLAAKLRQAISEDKVRLELLQNAGHADPAFEMAANVTKVLDFLGRWFRPAKTAAFDAAQDRPSRGALPMLPPRIPTHPGPPHGSGGPPGGPMPIPGVDFPCTAATPQYPDLPYATVSAAQRLDLYLPDGPGPFPVVLIIHGGAFMFGDKAHDISKAGTDQLLARGYAVANVNYRLSGEAKAPAQLHDVKAAVRWLRAHAREYRLIPDKFGAWGASAGANLAALLGTSAGVVALEGVELGQVDCSSRIQAVVDWFGPTDFLQMDSQLRDAACPAPGGHDAPDSPESLLIGAPIQMRPDLVRAVNPITYVSPESASFLIQHGTADCVVPPGQSQLLYDALLLAIGAKKVELTLIEGAPHGGGPLFWAEENVQRVLDFLDRFLK